MAIQDRGGELLALLSEEQREQLFKVQAALDNDPNCLDHPAQENQDA